MQACFRTGAPRLSGQLGRDNISPRKLYGVSQLPAPAAALSVLSNRSPRASTPTQSPATATCRRLSRAWLMPAARTCASGARRVLSQLVWWPHVTSICGSDPRPASRFPGRLPPAAFLHTPSAQLHAPPDADDSRHGVSLLRQAGQRRHRRRPAQAPAGGDVCAYPQGGLGSMGACLRPAAGPAWLLGGAGACL